MNKYRVWDRKLNGYFSDDLLISCDGDVMTWGVFSVESHDHPEDLIIERYTGLKDKNGVEIYEGDIVTIKHDDWDIQELRRVKYYGQFGYPAFDFSPSFDDVENGLSIVTQSDFYSVEVIGNIHENADLLKESK